MSQTMLIIDDETAVLTSCQRIFSEEGFEVTTTTNPTEGIDLAAKRNYTVVLCDWNMPECDGMNVVRTLEQQSPDSAIVMISGYPTVGRAAEAMKSGAMDYIAKPFTPEEILETVHKAIQGKIVREKKTLGHFEKILSKFPTGTIDDKGPKSIAETVADSVGVAKATSPWFSLFVLGIMAGAYIGFGALFSMSATFDMAQHFGIGMKKIMAGGAFSIGLMLVVIAGAELFTGNNLMVSSVFTGRITLRKMLAKWGIVYVANFIGSIILVLLFFYSDLWKTGGGALGMAAVKTANAKVHLSFGVALVRAIGCNWMVCLAVWMAMSSRQTIGKIFAILFPITAFVAMGFEHCVANMFFIPTGILLSHWAHVVPAGIDPASITWGSFVFNNLIPVTIGNIIGGAVFVGLGYWGAYLRPSRQKNRQEGKLE